MPDSRQRRVLLFLGAVAALGIALRLAFFAVSLGHLPVTADEALTTLTAKRILHGHRPLLVMANTYQFPLESYLTAPLVRLLPRTPLGARLLPFAMQLLALGLLSLVMRRLGPPSRTWPGWILLWVPSAYWLMLQAGYQIVEHSAFALLCAAALALAAYAPGWTGRGAAPKVLLAGFVSGLAFSNHMLALPVVALSAACVLLAPDARSSLRRAPFLLGGLLLGLIPYLLAKTLLPGCYAGVSGHLGWRAAVAKLLSPTLDHALPSALGIAPPLFPDAPATLPVPPGLAAAVGGAWVLLLLAASAWRLARFVQRTARSRWPTLDMPDVFVGVGWLSLALFLSSTRSHSHTFRYLLPAVWSFPFVVAAVAEAAGRWPRRGIACLAAGLALANAAAGARLIHEWRQPGFAARATHLYDLQPALDYLRARSITRCYASYWVAYRIDFMTDERVLCSQPYNERFFGWPIPFKAEVAASTNVAYVLSPNTTFSPERFEGDLAQMKVQAQRQACGNLLVYTDFAPEFPTGERRLPAGRFSATASHDAAEAPRLTDGRRDTRWRSGCLQSTNLFVALTARAPERLSRVTLVYTPYPYDRARALRLRGQDPHGEWTTLAADWPGGLDGFEFVNGHPEYGDLTQTIRFPPATVNALRIDIAVPDPARAWSISEVEVFGAEGER